MNFLKSVYALVAGLSVAILCCVVGFGLTTVLMFANMATFGFGTIRANGILTAWAGLSVVASILGGMWGARFAGGLKDQLHNRAAMLGTILIPGLGFVLFQIVRLLPPYSSVLLFITHGK